MKIQYLAVLFIVIILPISMVISYYVNAQIKTINNQELYDSKLITATYDAVRSFQLNSLNNKYASVSDSKMRDIEAGISSFFNSLGTELGASGYSRDDLSTFIPAILYSMYDGYYIYGKYYDEGIVTEKDENGNPTKYGDYRIGLKPYVFYSCRYQNGNSDFSVNYTLDNTITVYGTVKGKPVSSSGALVKIGKVTGVTSKDFNYYTRQGILQKRSAVTYAEYDNVPIKREVLTEKVGFLDENGSVISEVYEYIIYNDQKIYVERDGNYIARYTDKTYTYDNNGSVDTKNIIKWFKIYRNKKQYMEDYEISAFLDAMIDRDSNNVEHLYSNAACQYYADAKEFSEWVTSELGDIEQKHAIDEKGQNNIKFEVDTGNEKIFNMNNQDPMLEISTFNQNRISVIKKSIKTNLAAEMANFGGTSYDYRMPELTVEDWDKILNDVCVTTFMQGLPLGMKYYNNYCVVPNDKNKEVVTLDSIYIVDLKNTDPSQISDSSNIAHYPGCEELNKSTDQMIGYRNIDFERQTLMDTYDVPNHFYPHDNQKSYDCMVNAKSAFSLEDIVNGELYEYVGEERVKSSKSINPELRRAYLTAFAREKYYLYRTNGYFGLPE